MSLISQHGNRWRYEYNAAKSAVLVYGEEKKTQLRNSKFRNFQLGKKKVPEKQYYDHVGIKAYIFNNDTTKHKHGSV